MSPSREDERLKRLIGRMIETMTEEWNIPIGSGGSTTIKSEMKKRGLEPPTKKAMTAAASALMNNPD